MDHDNIEADTVINEDHLSLQRSRRTRHQELTQHPWLEKRSVKIDGIRVMHGDTVVLHACDDVLRVDYIYKHAGEDGRYILVGPRFRHVKSMYPGFDGDRNEVAMMQEVFNGHMPEELVRESFSTQDISQSNIPIIKKKLVLTNKLSKHIETSDTDASSDSDILVCRSKYICVYNNIHDQRKREQGWINLCEAKADKAFAVSDYHLRVQRRVHQQDGKHYTPSRRIRKNKRYTVGDGFCGAGFASYGALKAGLRLIVSFDHETAPMRTYRKNNIDVDSRRMSFFEFVKRQSQAREPNNKGMPAYHVDILTLSFPCQFFSWAHTVQGRNDEMNEAAWFGLGDILDVLKPRLVLIEQTSGIDRPKFQQHLMAVIAGFRNHRYSIQTKVDNFAGHGMPSPRKRLMFIAAA